MELNLHPIATKCCVTGRDFAENDRVVCFLVREPDGRTGRRDAGEGEAGRLEPVAEVYCRWVVNYKPRPAGENPDRALKLTAENLFLTLADPANPPGEVNTPMLQFLALMLERKRILKARGLSEDGQRQVFEHMPSHQLYEVPVGNLDESFFVRIREQLGVLVGEPKARPAPGVAAPTAAAAGV